MRKWVGLVIPAIFGVAAVYISQPGKQSSLILCLWRTETLTGWASTVMKQQSQSYLTGAKCVWTISCLSDPQQLCFSNLLAREGIESEATMWNVYMFTGDAWAGYLYYGVNILICCSAKGVSSFPWPAIHIYIYIHPSSETFIPIIGWVLIACHFTMALYSATEC